MGNLEFRVDKKKVVRGAVLFAGLTLAGVFLLLFADAWSKFQIIGGLATLICGAFMVAAMRQLRKPNSECAMRFDEGGIDNKRWKFGLVPWNKIQSAWIGSLKTQRFLCFAVDSDVLSTDQLSKQLKQLTKIPPVNLWFDDLAPGVDQAWKYIEDNFPEKVAQPKSY